MWISLSFSCFVFFLHYSWAFILFFIETFIILGYFIFLKRHSKILMLAKCCQQIVNGLNKVCLYYSHPQFIFQNIVSKSGANWNEILLSYSFSNLYFIGFFVSSNYYYRSVVYIFVFSRTLWQWKRKPSLNLEENLCSFYCWKRKSESSSVQL